MADHLCHLDKTMISGSFDHPDDPPCAWPREELQELSIESLRIAIVPGRGGKIASLRGPSGWEWLAQPATPVPPPAQPGAVFTDADLSGWDECAPTIDPCRVDGIDLPDHGELWTAPWTGPAHALTVEGPSFAYRLERRIRRGGPGRGGSRDGTPRLGRGATTPGSLGPGGTGDSAGGAGRPATTPGSLDPGATRDSAPPPGRPATTPGSLDSGATRDSAPPPGRPATTPGSLGPGATRDSAGGVRLEYTLQAGPRDVPWLWAAHPQFRAPRGTRIELPQGAGPFLDVLAPDPRPAPLPHGIDAFPDGAMGKYYLSPSSPAPDFARLRLPDGRSLTMSWDTTAVPYLGIWFDHRAFAREGVIALEPTTGYYDRLDRALADSRAAIVPAGERFTWWLAIHAD